MKNSFIQMMKVYRDLRPRCHKDRGPRSKILMPHLVKRSWWKRLISMRLWPSVRLVFKSTCRRCSEILIIRLINGILGRSWCLFIHYNRNAAYSTLTCIKKTIRKKRKGSGGKFIRILKISKLMEILISCFKKK